MACNQHKAVAVSRLYFENLLVLTQTSTLPQAGLTARLFNVYSIWIYNVAALWKHTQGTNTTAVVLCQKPTILNHVYTATHRGNRSTACASEHVTRGLPAISIIATRRKKETVAVSAFKRTVYLPDDSVSLSLCVYGRKAILDYVL